MKKIVFFLPSLNIGGIERVFITYANCLVKDNNYHIDFVLCKKEGDLLNLLSPEITVHDLGNIKLRHSVIKLRKYIKINKPDFIITGGDIPNLITIISSWKLKTKVIISQHNYYNIEQKRLGWWANCTLFLMKYIYPKAYKIIAISEGIYNFLEKEININSHKLIKLNNPIDINEIIDKSKENTTLRLPEPYIVFIGRLSYVKNLPFLIEAFENAQLNNIHLVIVGDGEMKSILHNKCMDLKKNKFIHFTGSLENPLPILKNARLLVLPSFSEAYPTILLESLCLSTPILATPTNGANEILKDVEGTSISRDFYDIKEFSKLLESSIQNKINKEQIRNLLNKNSVEYITSRLKNEILQ